MTVPSTPKLSDVVSEFGGPGNLRAYYRGGPYVPDINANAAISTSASSLKLSQFAGATNVVPLSVSVSDVSITTSEVPSPGHGPPGPTNYSGAGEAHAVTTGGDGTKHYSWSKVSGDGDISIQDENPASINYIGTRKITTGHFKCVVTDDSGSASDTFTVHYS